MSDEPASPFRPSTPTSTSNIPSFDPVAPPPTPVQPVARAARSSRGGTPLNGLIVVAALVAVGGIAFGVGRATASSSTGAGTGQGQLANGNRGTFPRGSFAPGGSFPAGGSFPGGGGGGITLQGTVVSVTADTLTLKTANGQTVEVPLASSTTYGTETASAASAVTQGAEVRVQLQGGRGAFGGGNGGNGGQGPGASAAPGSSAGSGSGRGFTLGPAQSVTVLP